MEARNRPIEAYWNGNGSFGGPAPRWHIALPRDKVRGAGVGQKKERLGRESHGPLVHVERRFARRGDEGRDAGHKVTAKVKVFVGETTPARLTKITPLVH